MVELALNALEEGEEDAGVSFAFEEELFLLARGEGGVEGGVAQECAAFFGGEGRDFERGGGVSKREGKAVKFAGCSGDQDKESGGGSRRSASRKRWLRRSRRKRSSRRRATGARCAQRWMYQRMASSICRSREASGFQSSKRREVHACQWGSPCA